MKKNIFLAVSIVASMILHGCATPTVNSAKAGYQLTKSEQEALGSGFVQMFSGGLPNYAYDVTMDVAQGINQTRDQIVKSINKYGTVRSQEVDLNTTTIVASVGSGSMNMNPAGLLISLTGNDAGTTVSVRAVAKEGVIKQNTSGKAVERLIADLEGDSKLKVQRK